MTDQISEIIVSRALSVVEKMASMMCSKPNEISMRAQVGSTKCEINFHVADSVDSKRLVGQGGARLKSFQALLAMLLRDSGIEAIIGRVEKDKDCPTPFLKFEAKADWDKEEIVRLFNETACACFPEQEVVTRAVDTSSTSTWLYAQFETQDEITSKFTDLAGDMFGAIGINHGRRIIVDSELK